MRGSGEGVLKNLVRGSKEGEREVGSLLCCFPRGWLERLFTGEYYAAKDRRG